jgi:hypothetical protein
MKFPILGFQPLQATSKHWKPPHFRLLPGEHCAMASTQDAVGHLENEVLFVVLQGIAVRYRQWYSSKNELIKYQDLGL